MTIGILFVHYLFKNSFVSPAYHAHATVKCAVHLQHGSRCRAPHLAKEIQGTHSSKYFLRYAVMLVCLHILNYAGTKMESSNSISLKGRQFLVVFFFFF